MNRVVALWHTSVGKKAVMAVTGIIMVAYLITHVLANLLVFQGPEQINTYSRFLHGTGGALWVARLVLLAALVLHILAAVQMVEAIALDKRRILPCSAWLQGEFGLRDVFCGVPCKLGRRGLERIVEITLTDAERAELVKSADAVRATQAVVDAI